MSAVVITPAYTHCHHGLEEAVRGAGLPYLRAFGHSDLPRVRSMLLEKALATEAERVILVDADTIPVPGVLEALATGLGVTPERAVWGLYPLRDGDKWSVNPSDHDEGRAGIAEGRPFPIITGGLGLCAIHRESLVRLAASLPAITDDRGGYVWHPFCVPFLRGNRYYADDASLCARLRESGTELWCEPTLRAGHAITTILRGIHG